MKKRWIIDIAISFAGMAAIVILTFLCFKYWVSNQQTCDYMTIDSIELQTGMDIPKVNSIKCECDEKTNRRSVYIELDTLRVNVEDYQSKYKLKSVDASKKKNLTYAQHKKGDVFYTVLIDKARARIWFSFCYLN